MYEIPFSKMIQPRVGATWAYNGTDTVFGSYARYNPAASSLPRAASWDRNLIGTFIDDHFDASGVLFAAVPVDSSSGKLFVARPDAAHRSTSIVVGTRAAVRPPPDRRAPTGVIVTPATSGRTRTTTRGLPSTRRLAFRASSTSRISPAKLAQIGNGSTYVIAELDGAYTKYYEVTARVRVARRQGASSAAPTPGATTTATSTRTTRPTANDANVFIGSSFIADGAGRQLWDYQGWRPARRPPAHAEALRLLQPAVERDRRRVLRRAVRSALGGLELRAVRRADDEHERRQPVG